MGFAHTYDTQSHSSTCEHSGCNSRLDLDHFYCDDPESGESEFCRDKVFVNSTIGLSGDLKPESTFIQACVPNNGILALHVGGKGPGNSSVIYFPRPQCLTQKGQVLFVGGHSGLSEQCKTHCLYKLSQTARSGHNQTIYLETEHDMETKHDDKETEHDKEEKTIVVPANIVKEEHLDLFEKDGWKDVVIKFFANPGDCPSVWVKEDTLL